MKKAFYLPFFAILLFPYNAFCGLGPDSLKSYSPFGRLGNKPTSKDEGNGFNIKTSPAFFWKTIGVEIEVPLGKKFSIGLNLYGKVGRTDGKTANFKVKKQNFLTDGMRAELAFKYYFKPTAPEGLYLQANFAYNQIVYADGTTKPYSLNSHTPPADTSATGTSLKPYPYSAGLGIGYQIIIIPKHLIGNFMIGAQGNMDAKNNPFISFFVAPSIGYVF
ncbi:MAG TPA: hypothetical protein VNW99_03065 [Cytophagaceae bacterium]|jgi:hypothetical protein|nr:hypothetical protein [Cytophagaceae bacterium]